MGVLYKAGDLCERRIRPDPGGAYNKATSGVDGGAGDRVIGADLDRYRFAGEQRCVDRGSAVDDDSIGGDLLAGANHKQVIHGEFLDGDADLNTVAEDGDILGAELEQCS